MRCVNRCVCGILTLGMLLLACGVLCAAASLPVPLDGKGIARRSVEDPRVRRYITPAKVLWQSDGVQNADMLTQPWSGQTPLGSGKTCTLTTKGRTGAILLDFGFEMQGGIQISAKNTARLRVRFGESVSEAMSELGGDKNATNDHAIRDQTCLVPFLGTHEIGNTGFRFVRIDLVDPDSTVELFAVRAIFVYQDLAYKGSFRCSDPRLNQIWMTGAYTVHLNIQNYVWDGIKRDRLVWIGDMHPETMTIGSVFGAISMVPASLDLVRDETPLPGWMNGISSYSMWWILIHRSWYQFTGDIEYLKQQKSYLVKLLNQLSQYVGTNNEETLPEGRFLDWPSNLNKPAIHAGLHSLLIMTLEAGADLCKTLDEPQTRQTCLTAVAKLRKHVPDPNGSKQAGALMALAGLMDAAKANESILAVDGAKRMSTFYGYYMLQARAKAGDYQGCLDVIRQYWGGMLDMGATTFWEDFDLDWTQNAFRIDQLPVEGKKDIHGDFGAWCYKGFRHSLCHGWASGPTAWMTEHVLGVRVVEPGCKTVAIEPHLGDLEWAEGTFPTPMGVIKIRHDKQKDGTVKSAIDAPEGVTIQRR